MSLVNKKRAVKKMLKSSVNCGINEVFKAMEGNESSICKGCLDTLFEERRQLAHEITCLIKKHGMSILDHVKSVAKKN